MNNLYRILISCCFILLFSAMNSQAQNNNLAAGDLALVSFQSDADLSNVLFGGTTNFWDRFSISILKSGGIPAGTVIYFTDKGWNASANDFTSGSEGVIKWTVPAGGVATGTEVYFISSYNDVTNATTWGAYTTESGTTSLGTVTNETTTPTATYMELSTAGDQVLIYQTGPAAGPAGAYNDATRRFIAAVSTNVDQADPTATPVIEATTFAAWDGTTVTGGNRSSLPPGLTNGTTAMLLTQATSLPVTAPPTTTDEPDNAKLTSSATACSTSDLATTLNNRSNWTYSNTAFAIGATSNHNTYTLTDPTTLPTTTTTITQAIGTNNNFFNTGCTLVTKVVPAGASPVAGNVTARVWVESSVPTFASQPFVARHYQITPATNATTATARVTLYFTQAEFNAFNAAPRSSLDLPTGSSDNAGKSNLRVGKYSGTSNNGTGLPGSYTSGTTIIDPADNDIVWNATYNRWEVTVDVTGFSGFIIQTSAFALPLDLISFTGQLNNNDVSLQWKTSNEINHSYFEVERSTDGQTYTAAGRITATGNNSSFEQNYSWIDAGAGLLNASKLFYRLKMVSTNGEVEYSSIATIKLRSTSPVVEVSPNPFTSSIIISLQMPEATRLNISISDITGKLLRSENIMAPKGITIHPVTGIENLTQGLYILSVKFNGQTYTYKIVK